MRIHPLKTTVAFAVLAAAVMVLPVMSRADKNSKKIIKSTMPAVVMVMAVNVVDGQLKPIASGSGTIIDSNGSVLTNYHVINDADNNRLYDLFVIGRFRSADKDPEMVCAGHPNRGKLKAKLDLALLKCDMDMNGRPLTPSKWPTLKMGRSEDIDPGDQIWVLGYPNVGGTTIHVTAGLVSGWTGEQGGATSRAFLKTDAAITHGNSGGTAVSEDGTFIGVPTAFRITTAQQGDAVATVGKVGLIRPIEHARDLLQIATDGWTPTETDTDPETVAPKIVVEPRKETGVVIASKVIDAANKKPVSGAFVIIFKPGVKTGDVSGDDLESQALAWGQTNAGGVFELQTPIPRGNTYAVAVIATGYHPVASDDGLTVADDAPDLFDPWSEIRLEKE